MGEAVAQNVLDGGTGQLVCNGRGNPVQTGASAGRMPRPTGQFSLGALRCKANPAPVLTAAATSRNVIDDSSGDGDDGRRIRINHSAVSGLAGAVLSLLRDHGPTRTATQAATGAALAAIWMSSVTTSGRETIGM
jgi:hypothetical protein